MPGLSRCNVISDWTSWLTGAVVVVSRRRINNQKSFEVAIAQQATPSEGQSCRRRSWKASQYGSAHRPRHRSSPQPPTQRSHRPTHPSLLDRRCRCPPSSRAGERVMERNVTSNSQRGSNKPPSTPSGQNRRPTPASPADQPATLPLHGPPVFLTDGHELEDVV
jgi:hypothetical protein